MKGLFFVMLSLAAAILSGCASKEKAEYQREVDAVPMPQTEAERIQQCQHFSSRAFSAYLEFYTKQKSPNIFGHPERPFYKRMEAMKCTQQDKTPAPMRF
ncbi:hypothetical protein [Pseudomonas protegens]|uniref:hypothetical protein n=1 Tax=Pseudomonas protegens TaxID=380021 RepID=UPI0012D74388|nr:hypothetical protein [Pseudomonas protegens]